MKFKESRSASFTSTEKYILLNIIYNYKDILENKKSDPQISKYKQETWKKIENCFNVLSDHNIYRTAKSLKKFYENKQKEIQIAEELSEMLKVDGVPLMTKDDSCKELFLDLTHNNFVTDEQDSPEEIVIEEVLCNSNKAVNNENSSEEIINLQLLDVDWEYRKPSDLQKEKLKEKIKITKAGKRNSRRRPIAITSDISKKYIDLAKIKSEVANLQRNMLIDERKTRTSEAILRDESLKLDIEIKKKQLEILTGMAKRHSL